jgi:PAS domain S-box-containing protein
VTAIPVFIDNPGTATDPAAMSEPNTDRAAADPRTLLSDDEQQFQLLVQSVTDYAIYMLDPAGVVTNWNAGGRRIKGYEDREIIGQHFSRFYTPEDQATDEPAKGLRIAREEGRFEKEGWRLRKDGTRFWANVVIDPIWQGGRLIGYAKVTRDITERKDAESRLDQARRALAESQKIEAIGKLTLGLAHDFNNLLTVIMNSLDLVLVHREDAERTRKLVEGASRAADRGALLTRQLLAFARGQSLSPEVHDVNALLMRSETLYRRACDTSIRIEFHLSKDIPESLVDAAQFEAAILNLVVNSRDAMPDGGTIAISTSHVPAGEPAGPGRPAGAFVHVTVADNGTGMSEEVRQRAVEPFFTTKDVGKGSGLGLSQVHGFAAQSGGYVEVESVEGRGTSVTLGLPVAGGQA